MILKLIDKLNLSRELNILEQSAINGQILLVILPGSAGVPPNAAWFLNPWLIP